jgi:hypothetical protein
MKTNRDTVKMALRFLNETFPGKLHIAPKKPGKEHSDTVEVWLQVLIDLDAGIVLAAVYSMVTDGLKWAPSVGDVRAKAIEIASGQSQSLTGALAWERVVKWSSLPQGSPDDFELTELELRALRAIGGSSTLNRTDIKSRGVMFSHFMKLYNEAAEAEKQQRNMLPEVREVIGRHETVKALPRAKPMRKAEHYLEPHEVHDLAKRMGVDVKGVMGLVGGILKEDPE